MTIRVYHSQTANTPPARKPRKGDFAFIHSAARRTPSIGTDARQAHFRRYVLQPGRDRRGVVVVNTCGFIGRRRSRSRSFARCWREGRQGRRRGRRGLHGRTATRSLFGTGAGGRSDRRRVRREDRGRREPLRSRATNSGTLFRPARCEHSKTPRAPHHTATGYLKISEGRLCTYCASQDARQHHQTDQE